MSQNTKSPEQTLYSGEKFTGSLRPGERLIFEMSEDGQTATIYEQPLQSEQADPVSDFVQKISLAKNGGWSFTGREFRNLMRPLVYIFLRDDRILYVGVSSHGLKRALEAGHQQKEARSICDEVRILTCDSLEDALKLEVALIRQFQPALNVAPGQVRTGGVQ